MDVTVALMQPLMMVVTTVVSAALGWVSSKYKAGKASAEAQKAEHEAMREACIIFTGARLDTLCDRYEQQSDHDPEDTQALMQAWQTYHGCGGDGVRTARVERCTGLRLEADK